MKKKIICLSVLLLIVLLNLISYKLINRKKIESIYDSFVYIECYDEETIKLGSGFVYKTENNKNYILTNYHVIEEDCNINVYNIKKEKTKAKIIKYDEDNDIAILTIEDKLNLKEANIGDSSNLKKGDIIYTLNFNNLEKGKILNSSDSSLDIYDFSLIKLNIKSDFGNSGGPVIDNKGKVIGMLFLKTGSNDNISFAIPINFINNESNFDLNRISLGAVMADSTNFEILNQYNIEHTQVNGVILLKLNENGILIKNGFKKGDIITSFNGETIENTQELKDALYKYITDSIIEITYYREGSYHSISLNLDI